MKKLIAFLVLALPLTLIAQSDSTIVIELPISPELSDSVIIQTVENLATLIENGEFLVGEIKEAQSQTGGGASGWIVAIVGLLGAVVSFITEIVKQVKSLRNLFRDNKTLGIVAIISAIVSAVYELIANGYTDEFANNMIANGTYSFVAAIVVYNVIVLIRSLFRKKETNQL